MKIKKIIVLISTFVGSSLIAEDKSGLCYQWSKMLISARYHVDSLVYGSDRADIIRQAGKIALDCQISLDKASDQLDLICQRVKLSSANTYLAALNFFSGKTDTTSEEKSLVRDLEEKSFVPDTKKVVYDYDTQMIDLGMQG
jgi:hypothetical protein